MESTVTSAQMRAARAILGWTMKDLAARSGVSFSTVRRTEDEERGAAITNANLKAILSALESAGIEFIEAEDGAPGIIIRSAQTD